MEKDPSAGDILLFRDGKKNAAIWAQRLNRFLGRSIRSGHVQISHAAICVCSEGILEAQPLDGVRLTPWAKLKGTESRLVALRPKSTPSRDVQSRAAYVIGRDYNALFDLHKHLFDYAEWDQPFFCSEVLDVFFPRQELGLPESGEIYPDDLMLLAESPEWFDVSEAYVAAIRKALPGERTPVLDAIKLMSELSIGGIGIGLGRIQFDEPELLEANAEALICEMEAGRVEAVRQTERAMEAQLHRRRRLSWLGRLASGEIFRGRRGR